MIDPREFLLKNLRKINNHRWYDLHAEPITSISTDMRFLEGMQGLCSWVSHHSDSTVQLYTTVDWPIKPPRKGGVVLSTTMLFNLFAFSFAAELNKRNLVRAKQMWSYVAGLITDHNQYDFASPISPQRQQVIQYIMLARSLYYLKRHHHPTDNVGEVIDLASILFRYLPGEYLVDFSDVPQPGVTQDLLTVTHLENGIAQALGLTMPVWVGVPIP